MILGLDLSRIESIGLVPPIPSRSRFARGAGGGALLVHITGSGPRTARACR